MADRQANSEVRHPFARWRSSDLALALVLAGALATMLAVVNWHYAIVYWLFWRFLLVAGLAVGWAVSCLSGGYFLLGKLRLPLESAVTEAVLAFPLGVLAFQSAIFVLGLVHLLGVVTFFVLPLVFLGAGRDHLRRAARACRSGLLPPRNFVHLAMTLFGVAGVAVLYFQILSPASLHWDARWYHLPLGQLYALQGGIWRSPERWWLAGYPHGASLLYAWAFLLPHVLLFDQLELCLHIELVVFLGTIASIPTLVRHLVSGVKTEGTWAAIFLFPGIFLYDSNLAGAADHIAALFCIPITIALIRLWRRWEVGEAILFGAFIGAALIAKYSVWMMLFLPGLLFLIRAVGLGLARRRGGGDPAPFVVRPLLAGLATILIVSAQHWLKNWIWYGDPLYPILAETLHVKPWSAEASASYHLFDSFHFAPPPGWEGLRDALQSAATFAFIPNDWPVFHRNVPVFGFLFSLSALCLPFVRAGARLWLTYLGVLISIVFWYLTTHQDRYLQSWLPVMVACTVSTLGLAWQRRTLAVRGLIIALLGFQIVWGGDVPFFPTHNLINDSPIRLVSGFLASGFLRTPNRLRLFGDEGLVAERLPRDANLLVHETNMHVGFGVRAVNDQWQSRISYAALASPAAIYRELADMKVTHLVWEAKATGWNSVGSDLAFMSFVLNHAVEPEVFGTFTLARFPAAPPPETFNDRVAVLACNNPFSNGFYRIHDLIIPAPGRPWAVPEAPVSDPQTAIRQADFIVVDPGCMPAIPPEIAAQFHPPYLNVRSPLQIYIRRR